MNKNIQGTISAIQRLVQNLGITLYAAITGTLLYLHNNLGVKGYMAGISDAWYFASTSLFLSLFFFAYFSFYNRLKKSRNQALVQ